MAALLFSQGLLAGQVLFTGLKDLTPLSDAVLKIGDERYFLSGTGTTAFNLAPGVYSAVLQQYGQQLLEFKFELTEAENIADISVLLESGVEPKVEVTRYPANDERLNAPGTISGYVTNKESGDPLAGVVIRDESGKYSVASKQDGS